MIHSALGFLNSTAKADVLQLLGRVDHGVEVERLPGELGQFRQKRRVHGGEVEDEERLVVHLVRGVEVGVELVDLTVGQHRHPGIGDREVAEELGGVFNPQRIVDLLGFNQNLYLTPVNERVVDLLAALDSYVGGELWDHLGRVEHVITEHEADERHDEGVLGRLLGLDACLLLAHLARQLEDALTDRH